MAVFDGKVALVTGGGRGIGRAMALSLVKFGAKVAVTARSGDEIEAVEAEIRNSGGEALAIAGDVSDYVAVQRIVAEVEEILGPVAILVNNAATVGAMGLLEETDPDQWTQTQRVNVFGPYYLIRETLPGMKARGYGRIINVSSSAGIKNGISRLGTYSVSKAALDMLTRNTAVDLADSGVTINAMYPGVVDTAMTRTVSDTPASGAVGQRFTDMRTANKMFTPEAIGDLMVAIALSDKNGEVLDVRYDTDALNEILARVQR